MLGVSRARSTALAMVVVVATTLPAVLAGCGRATPVSPTEVASTSSEATPDGASQNSASKNSASPNNASPNSASQGAVGPGGTVLGGSKIVLLDPGHSGGNAAAPAEINKQVPDGRQGTKACNTTGTATDDGFAEHTFAWIVAQQVRQDLERTGVTVKMTRDNDTGVGPCVDVRGQLAEEVNADAVVSIHADGAPPDGHGFHVAYSSPPLSQSQGEPSVSLATALRDAMRGAGLPTSTYAGKDGLTPRADLAGLNFARRPAALVECDNMRNRDEAVVLRSPAGQARIADAIAGGVLAWLAKH
ncbi:MAG: N-acetylmuramoyl-L-alanine amidase [Pseudonocardia sp.]